MLRIVLLALVATAVAAPAAAQPVEVTQLAAPDAFSTPGRETGLPATLWRGAYAETARAVLPLLASKPVSPAARALARRVLATGAPGPAGVGDDPSIASARTLALMALGDPRGAAAILQRAPGLDRSPELAQAAAESALLGGDDARACAIAEGLSAGRELAYWLRLRAYCHVLAGQTAAAQLTLELAQAQTRDAVYGRLMAAKLSGAAPATGAASLRNGLDYAISRSLGLDLSTAKPAPAVAAALAPEADLDPPPPPLPADEAGSEPAVLLLASVGGTSWGGERRLASLTVPAGKMPAGRALALDRAVADRAIGETALLVLWTATEAGAAGPGVADRARLAHALWRVGLEDDAIRFVLEGLAGLK